MKIFKILIPILMFTVLFSCDKIEVPLKTQEGTCGDASIQPIKKILVEEYTGIKCSTCPAAAEVLHEIKNDYCDHVIPIAIHVGYFATPNSTYTEDYRTEAGTELANNFIDPGSVPWGVVNRTEYNSEVAMRKDNWRAAVDTLHKLQPEINIIVESTYNDATKEIVANIKLEVLKKIPYNFNLGLYVTEDSIISKQAPNYDEYIHRHMLRKAITKVLGDEIANSAEEGNILEKSFTFNANEEWNMKHIELVAFISNRETKEIIQAESAHIEQ